jgi:tRNA1(Val) A37 N6-methylase TrmN6
MGELLLLADGLGIADNVSLHVSSMENMTMDAESIDLVLTSPPYFDKEHYCDEVGQSDMMYKSRQGWIDGFLTILGRRAATALKSSGKYVLIVDADLIVPAIETAKGAGFLQLEQLPLLNAKTHLTGKKSMECVLAFQRP